GGRQIVVAALGNDEYQQRYNVHPAQSSVPFAFCREQIEVETGDPQREREEGQLYLAGKKALRSSLAYVPGMDVLQKIERYEFVLRLPDQVRQEDQQRDRNAAPQPSAFQMPAHICRQHSDDQTSNQKRHAVLRQHSESDRAANRNPPARIIGLE